MNVKITKYMSRIVGFLLILIAIISCKNESKVKSETLKIKVDLKVERFEQQFYTISETDLPMLKTAFPFMFPKSINDSVWIQKIKSEDEQFLFAESQRVFGDFEEVKSELTALFQQIKYRYPKFKEPTVITHISDLDFQYPVIYADSLLFISLDMYLGANNEVYYDFPKYLAQNFTKEHLIVDVSNEINNSFYRKLRSRTFLDRMINEGKFLYATDVNLPNVNGEIKIGYTKEKLNWAKQNEDDVWKYFIENELLFSNDASLNSRFIDVAPFSKFYLESDNDSPGRIGVWIGWQIVRSYMKNNDVALQELMTMKAEDIYKNSKYKPRRE